MNWLWPFMKCLPLSTLAKWKLYLNKLAEVASLQHHLRELWETIGKHQGKIFTILQTTGRGRLLPLFFYKNIDCFNFWQNVLMNKSMSYKKTKKYITNWSLSIIFQSMNRKLFGSCQHSLMTFFFIWKWLILNKSYSSCSRKFTQRKCYTSTTNKMKCQLIPPSPQDYPVLCKQSVFSVAETY